MKRFDVGAAVRRAAGVVGVGALVVMGMAVPAHADADPLPRENDFGFHGDKDIDRSTKVGDQQSLQFGFTNASKEASDGALVLLRLGPGLAYEEKFSNCEYVKGDSGYFANYTLCSFKGDFEAGASYAFDKKLTLTTLPTAFVDFYAVAAYPDTPAIREKLHAEAKYAPGSGPELSVTKTDAFSAPAGAKGESTISATDNRADFGLTGATAEGAPGSTVSLQYAWRNDGPATITEPWNFSKVATVELVLPKGVTLVDGCTTHDGNSEGSENGAAWYSCDGPKGWQVPANTGGKGSLKVKIDEGAAQGELVGEVKWTTRSMVDHLRIGTFDNTPANNSAKLLLKVTGGGTPTTGPSGSPSVTPSSSAKPTSGTGTPTAGATPSAGASATAAATATATATPAPGASANGSSSGGGGGGGGLASTGTVVAGIAGTAAVALGAGIGFRVLSRRRAAA